MGEDSGEKTEEPTPHKLREARKKGQIAKSKELTSAILVIVSFYAFKAMAVTMWDKMTEITRYSFDLIPETFSFTVAGKLLKDVTWVFSLMILPLLLINFVAAIILETLQTGFLISMDPIIPKLDKLNPIEGIKKFFSLKQLVELLKSIIKMFIVVWLLYTVIREEFFMVVIAQQLTLWQIMQFTGSIVMKVVVRVGLAYFILAVLDYFYQKWEFLKSMKMTKKEIKDEYKRLEGDPMIKQRQRDAQRQMAQGRQMGSVPGADVVVTNPTHYAIAIEYKVNKMPAPIVLAKGQRLVALQIIEIAKANDIPIVENPPLARAMYKEAVPEAQIPPKYYQAVAEILAFVYNLKKKRKHRY